ncbi:MAG: L-ribulose-5-phosphate 3-epimerase [Eubacterium sp.]|nr:L-ribulose-5-phosphate 3-epimerase [Eubacterium sp.]
MTKAYTLGLYEKAMPGTLSWKEKMFSAKKAGFDFIEISIDETEEKLARLDMSKEERFELVKLMYETGMPIRSLCLSGHRKYPLGSNNPDICKRGMEIMKKTIQFADDLGIRIIMLAGYDVYYEEGSEETKARFVENMKKAVLMAAKAGILMGFETMETEFMNTVGKAMDYVNLINSVYLNVYPDAGNITNAAVVHKEDVLADLKKGAGKITSMHLKETVPGKFREIPFGTGNVDFEAMIKTAWSMGVRRFVTEFWYTGNEAWEEDMVFAHDMMCDIFEKQQ